MTKLPLLHRIAWWKPSKRVPFIWCTLSWVVGMMLIGSATWFGWVNGTPSAPNRPNTVLVIGSFAIVAAIVQTILLIWEWEEKQLLRTPKNIQAEIAALERELGIAQSEEVS